MNSSSLPVATISVEVMPPELLPPLPPVAWYFEWRSAAVVVYSGSISWELPGLGTLLMRLRSEAGGSGLLSIFDRRRSATRETYNGMHRFTIYSSS